MNGSATTVSTDSFPSPSFPPIVCAIRQLTWGLLLLGLVGSTGNAAESLVNPAAGCSTTVYTALLVPPRPGNLAPQSEPSPPSERPRALPPLPSEPEARHQRFALPVPKPRRLPPVVPTATRTVPPSVPRQADSPPLSGNARTSTPSAPVSTGVPSTGAERGASASLPAPSRTEPHGLALPSPPEPKPRWQRFEPQIRATIRRGYEMASRGASFSARAEFLQALRMMTQVLDTAESTQRHSAALARAMRAMREAEDFIPRRAGRMEQPDLRRIVTGHRAAVLAPDEASRLTPLAAMQRYFTLARAQLAVAVADVPLSAEALFALGKMQPLMNDDGEATAALKAARSLVFFQVALQAEPGHARAANELGVTLAKIGRWEEAREVLRQAVATAPSREIWHNLAAVHAKLGETRLAELAKAEAARAHPDRNIAPTMTKPLVQWVDDSVFRTARPAPAKRK